MAHLSGPELRALHEDERARAAAAARLARAEERARVAEENAAKLRRRSGEDCGPVDVTGFSDGRC